MIDRRQTSMRDNFGKPDATSPSIGENVHELARAITVAHHRARYALERVNPEWVDLGGES